MMIRIWWRKQPRERFPKGMHRVLRFNRSIDPKIGCEINELIIDTTGKRRWRFYVQ
jgi:hypothetical protein